MDLDMATGGTDDGTAGIIGGGLDPVVVGAQGYYNNGIGGSATGGGSPATEPSATNNLSNLYVIFQNASLNSNIISGNGHTTDNTTTKEHIVGMDNENVFTFMYAVSCSGYIVNLTLLFTICCRQKFRRFGSIYFIYLFILFQKKEKVHSLTEKRKVGALKVIHIL